MEWLVPLSLWGSKVFRIGPPAGTQCVFRIVTKSEDLAQPTNSPQVIIIMADFMFLLGLKNAGMFKRCVIVHIFKLIRYDLFCKQHNDTLRKPTKQIFYGLEAELKPKSDTCMSMDSCWGSHLGPLQAGAIGNQNGCPEPFFAAVILRKPPLTRNTIPRKPT